jgi:hypothetical protein
VRGRRPDGRAEGTLPRRRELPRRGARRIARGERGTDVHGARARRLRARALPAANRVLERSRRPHRAPQLQAVLPPRAGSGGAGAARRPRGGGAQRRPQPVQPYQPGPRIHSRRPAPAGGRRAPSARRLDRWTSWRATRPTSSSSSPPTSPGASRGDGTDEGEGTRQARAVADAIHASLERPFDIDDHESTSTPRSASACSRSTPTGRHAAAPRRPGGAGGQATRRGADASVRGGHERPVEAALAGHAPPQGHRPRGAPAPLPADREAGRTAGRRRVPERLEPHVFALEALVRWQDGERHRSARGLPARRGPGADRADRRVGNARGLPPGTRVAIVGIARGDVVQHLAASCGSRTSSSGSAGNPARPA